MKRIDGEQLAYVLCGLFAIGIAVFILVVWLNQPAT